MFGARAHAIPAALAAAAAAYWNPVMVPWVLVLAVLGIALVFAAAALVVSLCYPDA